MEVGGKRLCERDVPERYLTGIVPSHVYPWTGRWPTPLTHMNGNENLGNDLNESKRFADEILLLRAMFALSPPLKNTSGHPDPRRTEAKTFDKRLNHTVTGASIPI